MGIFRKKIKNAVAGTAQIVSMTRHDGEGVYQSCRLQLVVQVDGIEPYPTELNQILPRKKWPQPGMSVPVLVSRDDPHKLKIDVDKMPSNADVARQIAEQQAQAMQQGQSMQQGPAAASPQVQIVGDVSSLSPEQIAKVERLTGMDLDGDGVVGGAGAAPAAAASSAGGSDRIAQLERLAQLHGSGALTDAEFAAEKARILHG